MNIKNLNVEQVKSMSYVDFVSLLNETNRPPGGKKTIRTVVQNSFLNRDSSVLEIGCNTGFSSIEIAAIVKCNVIGIDVNEISVKVANENANTHLVSDKVNFQNGNVESLEFADESFDLIMGGGAIAWVKNRSLGIEQCLRVLKPWGLLSVVPFFYHTPPPNELLKELNSSLNINIQPWQKDFWIELFVSNGFELYFEEDKKISPVSSEKINDFLKMLLNPVKSEVNANVFEAFLNKGKYYYNLFNENHKYLSYGIYLMRKRPVKEQLELF
jgi:ubiquinone/menaquinone biosynthesis C-methylase UbiE